MKRIITLSLITSLPGLAQAHGNAGHSIMANLQHIVSSPEHLWPLALLGIVAITVKSIPQRLMRRIKLKTKS